MRIIAGKYAKRKLATLNSRLTRPTSDKVKESLFNILGQFFLGGRVLDLYAGSGALGIEAVSRGMQKAYLVDKAYPAINIIKKNVALTKEESAFNIMHMSDRQAIDKLMGDHIQFDLVFLDPPYAQQKIVAIMGLLQDHQLLADNARIVVETDDQAELRTISGFSLQKEQHYGQTIIRIYQRG